VVSLRRPLDQVFFGERGKPLRKRLVFMGSDTIALPALDFLANGAADRVEFAGIFTQPDRPSGRGKQLRPNGIKEWALARGIRVHQPEKFGEGEVALLRDVSCDLVLVMAYGHILRKEVLALPPLGTFNLHASLLPKFRGASPIQAALSSGEQETGVTLMRMVRRLDAGPMIDRESFPVDELETGASAEEKMATACVPLLSRNLDALLEGSAPETDQDDGAASFCRKLQKTDGVLDFGAPATVLARRINALFPWPGCYFDVGDQRIKVGLAASSGEVSGSTSGTVLDHQNGLRVATGEGTLLLLKVQRPGGKMLDAGEFLRGFSLPQGTVLPSLPMPAFVAPEPFRAV